MKLDIDLYKLSEMEVSELADHLSCRDIVIKNVADQIIDGWTEMNSHGWTSTEMDSKNPTPLEAAILKVASMSSKVAERVIKKQRSYMGKLKTRFEALEAMNKKLERVRQAVKIKYQECSYSPRKCKDCFSRDICNALEAAERGDDGP